MGAACWVDGEGERLRVRHDGAREAGAENHVSDRKRRISQRFPVVAGKRPRIGGRRFRASARRTLKSSQTGAFRGCHMNIDRSNTRYALLAAMLAFPGLALAGSHEAEPNHPVGLGQTLGIVATSGQATGGAEVNGVVGSLSGAAVVDVDYYTFSGKEGDVVTVDIDGGMGGARNVDTILGLFGPGPAYALLRTNDDAGYPLDPGSSHPYDSRIDNFKLPSSGTYTVGVSSFPRRFANGGGTTSNTLSGNANGDYTLVISGVSLPVLQISIEIKPGSGDVAPINPKSRGKVPVALLGAADFSVLDVDTGSVTFGHSGNEPSLSKCGPPQDVNDDPWPDMVCHFENQAAGFVSSDEEGIVKGRLDDGRAFEGRGWLKVVPVKAQY